MKRMFSLVVCIVFFSAIFNPLYAGEKALSKEQAIALFKDKTFDGFNEKKEKNFRVYSSADGEHTVTWPSGKTKKGTWHIDDDGRHCVELSKMRCTQVFAVGGGVYHKKKDNGKHTHTLKNFVDGNQL